MAFLVSFRHQGGAVSTTSCSFYSRRNPEPFSQTLAAIEGTEGTIDIHPGYRLLLHGPDGTREIDVEPPVPTWGEKPWHVVQDSVVAIQRHWIACLRAGVEPETSGADNLKTLELAMLAYDSAERDEAIAVASRA
jgi:D-apiose dehydrogenase